MNFLPHSFTHSLEQCWTTTQDDILEQILSNINITFLDRVIAVFMDTFEIIESSLFWCEENFSCSEPFVTDQDFSSIWEFIILFTSMTLFGFVFGSFIIVDNVAHFFFNVFYDFNFGSSCETISSLIKNFLQIVSNISTG